MSNALAIATVTATLQHVLTDVVQGSGVGSALVTTLRPDAPSGLPAQGVNVFLYQVSPNPAWRNADAPTRRPDGSLRRRPQAALDLHYLFTFYGDDLTLDQQRLLGVVVRHFHAAPVLARSDIAAVRAAVPALNDTTLADQVELVRLTPINFSLEELSKLWAVFPKTDYVLSVAYQAGVVLIETDDPPPGTPLPVLRANVTAVPFSPAEIDAVEPHPVELPFSASAAIALVGRNLDPADEVAFTTPGVPDPIPATATGPGGRRLAVALPPGLRPGVNTIRLARLVPGSPPGSAHVLYQSNAAAFVLRPAVQSIDPGPGPGQVTAVVFPAVGPRQRVSLLLSRVGGSQAFALPAEPRPADSTALVFSCAPPPQSLPHSAPPVRLPAGTYLARVSVDGAESRLETTPAGAFGGPTVTIP